MQNEDLSDCVDAQADSRLRWANISEGTVSHVTDQIEVSPGCLISFCVFETHFAISMPYFFLDFKPIQHCRSTKMLIQTV